MVENVFPLILDGVALGCMYALIALGYTMVYGIIKLINFAHGEFCMMGAYVGPAAIALLGGSTSGYRGHITRRPCSSCRCSRPRILLLDEPSLGLAPIITERVFKTVARIREEGVTILIVEQNAHMALEIADRAYVLETGGVAMSGPAADLAADPAIAAAYLGGA